MDGEIAGDPGGPSALVCTISRDVLANLTHNLSNYETQEAGPGALVGARALQPLDEPPFDLEIVLTGMLAA
jgi:hypothetical protein